MYYSIPAHLNYTDLNELKPYMQYMPDSLSKAFQTKRNMIDAHPQRFARAHQYHSEMTGLMTMSGHTLARRFLMCGANGRPCGLVKWCDFCAYVRKMKLMRGFLTRFGQVKLWFLTVSFNGLLSFIPGYALDAEVYWDAAVNAVKQMVEEQLFQGVFWAEELFVQSLLPPLVKPHIHAIIAADDIRIGLLESLWELVAAYRAADVCYYFKQENLPARMFQVTRPITTRTYELKSEIDLANVLGYMVKTLNLPQAYLAGWPNAEANARERIPWLNQGVNDVVDGFELCVGIPFHWDRFCPPPRGTQARRRPSRRQFGYKGSFHSRHHDFFGVEPVDRDTVSRRQVIDAILTDHTVEKAMGLWQPDWLGQSIEEQIAYAEGPRSA